MRHFSVRLNNIDSKYVATQEMSRINSDQKGSTKNTIQSDSIQKQRVTPKRGPGSE